MTYRGYEIIHDEDAAAFDLPPFFIEQADGFFAEFNTEREARQFVDHITREWSEVQS